MKNNKRKKINSALSTLSVFLLVVGFQNCSKMDALRLQDDIASDAGGTSARVAPFTCEPGADPAPVAMRRLTKTEYINTVKALLSKQTTTDRNAILSGLAPFFESIPEDRGAKFNRTDSFLDQAHISGYFYAADKLGALVTATETRAKNFFGSCAGTADLGATCMDQFLSGYAAKIYRRPLTTGEMTSLRTDFAAFASGTRNSALIARMFTSPRFLMTIEDGGSEVSPSLLQVSPYELASRLSYHFLSTMPDDQLWATAADGSLLQDAVLKTQIDRLSSGANLTTTQSTIAEFYSQWLGLSNVVAPENATGAHFLAFADGARLTRASMIQEIQDMVNYYTFTQNGSFNDLLSSPYSFAKSDDLADIYGVAPWSGDPETMVRFPAGERSGLLTRAAFLVNGGAETNPVKRGLIIRQAFLCDVIPPPPADISNMVRVPEMDPNFSTRQRYEHKTSAPLCMSCHSQINPLGFALESFDALGRYRNIESIFDSTGKFLAERRVDPVVQPRISYDDQSTSSNAVQFNQIVSDNGKAHKCFVQQYFNFTYRQPANVQTDGCALEDMRQNLSGPDGSLKKTLMSVPLSRAFKLKKI